MENNGKARCHYYPANTTFVQYISSWEADREGKPWAFPVLCFRLTFKIYCFKMLIIMSDISCVTKWVAAAEGETFFLTIFLIAKAGWLEVEQRWADGSSRGAGRANTFSAFLWGRWGGPAAKQIRLVACTEPSLNHSKQLLQQHPSTSCWFRLSTHKSTRQEDESTVEPPSSELALLLHSHPEQDKRKVLPGFGAATGNCIQIISGELKHYPGNVIDVYQL